MAPLPTTLREEGDMSDEAMDVLLARADDLHARSCDLLDEARAVAVHRQARRGVYVHLSPVSVQKLCSNRKIAPQRQEAAKSGRIRNVPTGPFASSTYVSVSGTCPDSCIFKDHGCYAQTGSYGWKIRKLDTAAASMTSLEVLRAEADRLDSLFPRRPPQDGACGGRDLRLHISGDVSCARGAQVLGEAVARYRSRGGGACWTYTHRWSEVPLEAWGPVQVLASVESPDELEAAVDRGYAPALTVEAFSSPQSFRLPGSSVRLLPCRAETSRTTCVQCRLCLEPGLLQRGTGVAFALHGMGLSLARHALGAK